MLFAMYSDVRPSVLSCWHETAEVTSTVYLKRLQNATHADELMSSPDIGNRSRSPLTQTVTSRAI